MRLRLMRLTTVVELAFSACGIRTWTLYNGGSSGAVSEYLPPYLGRFIIQTVNILHPQVYGQKEHCVFNSILLPNNLAWQQCRRFVTFWYGFGSADSYICGFVPLSYGFGSCSFLLWLSRREQRKFFLKFLLLFTFWRYVHIILQW